MNVQPGEGPTVRARVRALFQGDARYLISNSKDQTIKLWDTRSMAEWTSDLRAQADSCRSRRWDYRWETYQPTGAETATVTAASADTIAAAAAVPVHPGRTVANQGAELGQGADEDVEAEDRAEAPGARSQIEAEAAVDASVGGARSGAVGDLSLMTYRGHRVLETLVRCYFSPAATTGQRYIYTGSQTGDVVIYDVLTGHVVSRLTGHHGTVRDVSWHPHQPILLSASWDGTVGRWEPCMR